MSTVGCGQSNENVSEIKASLPAPNFPGIFFAGLTQERKDCLSCEWCKAAGKLSFYGANIARIVRV
jgi:hypothetical protein